MIAIDTSALVAIILDEPERDAFKRVLESASRVLILGRRISERQPIDINAEPPKIRLLQVKR